MSVSEKNSCQNALVKTVNLNWYASVRFGHEIRHVLMCAFIFCIRRKSKELVEFLKMEALIIRSTIKTLDNQDLFRCTFNRAQMQINNGFFRQQGFESLHGEIFIDNQIIVISGWELRNMCAEFSDFGR